MLQEDISGSKAQPAADNAEAAAALPSPESKYTKQGFFEYSSKTFYHYTSTSKEDGHVKHWIAKPFTEPQEAVAACVVSRLLNTMDKLAGVHPDERTPKDKIVAFADRKGGCTLYTVSRLYKLDGTDKRTDIRGHDLRDYILKCRDNKVSPELKDITLALATSVILARSDASPKNFTGFPRVTSIDTGRVLTSPRRWSQDALESVIRGSDYKTGDQHDKVPHAPGSIKAIAHALTQTIGGLGNRTDDYYSGRRFPKDRPEYSFNRQFYLEKKGEKHGTSEDYTNIDAKTRDYFFKAIADTIEKELQEIVDKKRCTPSEAMLGIFQEQVRCLSEARTTKNSHKLIPTQQVRKEIKEKIKDGQTYTNKGKKFEGNGCTIEQDTAYTLEPETLVAYAIDLDSQLDKAISNFKSFLQNITEKLAESEKATEKKAAPSPTQPSSGHLKKSPISPNSLKKPQRRHSASAFAAPPATDGHAAGLSQGDAPRRRGGSISIF